MLPSNSTSLRIPAIVLTLFAMLAPLSTVVASDEKQRKQFREARATTRRLSFCSWCVHGSRDWGWLQPCQCKDGWEGSCCNTRVELHDGREFVLHRIKNNEVEQELAFARTDSELPAALHGIFWMDQRGVHVSTGIAPSDPDYKQVGESAADELLVAFGEAHWDPETRCAGPVPVAGGKQGHWTFMDQEGPPGPGASNPWSQAYSIRLYGDFCFRSDNFDVVDLHMYKKVLGVWVRIPWTALHLTMKKTAWGWDRQTTSILSGSKVYHYPVFQIVDGDGKRTKHYDAYLKWANTDTTHTDEGFSTPINRGSGTSLVGRLRK